MSSFTADKIKNYIKQNYEDKLKIQHFYIDNIPLFLKDIRDNKIGENELSRILDKNPELSMQTYQGLHSIHYALLSNDIKTIKHIINTAAKNGLKYLPVTEITSDSKYENNQHILKFCYKQNKINSFITLFEFCEFNEKEIADIALLSMVDLNSDFNSFFKSVYGKNIMNDHNHNIYNQKKYSNLLIDSLISTKGDIKVLKKFGYDFFKESEKGTLLHSVFSSYMTYKLDYSLSKSIMSLDKRNSHFNINSYFMESVLYHKDLNIDARDEHGTPLYELIEKKIVDFNLESHFSQRFKIKLDELILLKLTHHNSPESSVRSKIVKF